MRDAYPEFGVPELEQRLTLKKVDCAARGGLNLGSCYLISGTGIATTKNLDLLHCLAGMLKRISGPWIIGGDFNGTPEELAATGWLKVVGGRIHQQEGAESRRRPASASTSSAETPMLHQANAAESAQDAVWPSWADICAEPPCNPI